MTTQSINDYITNIKTFQEYLDHIVDSVESDRYHLDTIKKISDLISKYYSEVNYDDDDVEVIVDSNNSKDSRKSTSSKSIKNKKNENIDRYVFEFGNGEIDNKDLLLYKKNPKLVQISDSYLNNKY